MKPTCLIFSLLITFCWSCSGPSDSGDTEQPESKQEAAENISTPEILSEESVSEVEEPEAPSHPWKNLDPSYSHFRDTIMDTVVIQPLDTFDLVDYFNEEVSNKVFLLESGVYSTTAAVVVHGQNVVVKGRGEVSIILNELHDNVMWVHGDNIVIDNLHMKHTLPGDPEGQNCTGRVIGFDGASNITIINCDLNGCGLSGLHDNVGNERIFVEYNHIHNNSLGAYTNITGDVWQEEGEHEVFRFLNNLIENNGHGRFAEAEEYYHEEDYYDGEYYEEESYPDGTNEEL